MLLGVLMTKSEQKRRRKAETTMKRRVSTYFLEKGPKERLVQLAKEKGLKTSSFVRIILEEYLADIPDREDEAELRGEINDLKGDIRRPKRRYGVRRWS